ncbi:YidH family protein [Alkalicoccus chagannorensis]|uniref:YidH family protein n=1 Tax=Alkalicoccus chagannorensis TaxID=427072 RepID=UPI0004029371|nr:DUF202 domain-containing protein [Alkalicoccus chagannorensis]
MKEEQRTTDSSYIQQHLANERTFLAWVRTALTMKGIGFLVFSLELMISGQSVSTAAQLVSAVSFVAGLTILSAGTLLYFRSKKTINDQLYRAASTTVVLTAVLVAVVLTVIFLYALTVGSGRL